VVFDGQEVEEQENGKSKSRPKAMFVPTMILLFFMIVAVIFLFSPFFNITGIEVYGSKYFSEQEIMLLSGINEEQNIFTAPLNTIEQRLMRIPRLASVNVERNFPNQLRISVEERQTVAYVPYAGYFVELDEQGHAICITESVTDVNIPIISGINVTYAEIGQDVSPVKEISECCKVGAMLIKKDISDLSEVSISEDGLITVITIDGTKILLGKKDGIESTLELLVPILNSVREQARQAKVIDLRVESKPVVTY